MFNFKSLSRVALAATLVAHSFGATAAVVAYVGNGSTGNYLSSFGHSVTQITDPTSAGFLAGYDAVVVSSNFPFTNATLIGDEVKAFADAGGGVVLAQFVFQGVWSLSGGINSAGYNPFVNDPTSVGYTISSALGTVYDASSELFDGLTIANIATTYQADVGLDAGATLVADWTSSRHAIAYNSLANSTVVGLNLFPSDGYLNADTQRLVSNAINFSLDSHGGGNVPEPSALALVGVALLGMAAARSRKAG